jgi:hypothetical protein
MAGLECPFVTVPIDIIQTQHFVIKNPIILTCFGSYGTIISCYTTMCTANTESAKKMYTHFKKGKAVLKL